LQQLARDPAELVLFRNGELAQYSVGQLSREALALVELQTKY